MDKVEITYHLSNGADGGYRAEAFADEARAVEAAERLATDRRISQVRFVGDVEFVAAASAAYYSARDAYPGGDARRVLEAIDLDWNARVATHAQSGEAEQEYDLCLECWPLNRAAASPADSPQPIMERFICAACLRPATRGMRAAFAGEEPFESAV